MQDSVKISYRHLTAANGAFIELKYYKANDTLQNNIINSNDKQISYLLKVVNSYKSAVDTFSMVIIPELEKKDSFHQELYQKYKKAFKRQKAQKIAIGTMTPLLIGVGVVIGYLFGR